MRGFCGNKYYRRKDAWKTMPYEEYKRIRESYGLTCNDIASLLHISSAEARAIFNEVAKTENGRLTYTKFQVRRTAVLEYCKLKDSKLEINKE